MGGAAVALLLASLAGAYQHGRSTMDLHWQARWSERDAADRLAASAAQEQARNTELERQSIADSEDQKNNARIKLLESRLADTGAQSDGMRREIERLRNGRSATCDTISAQQREAAGSTIGMLGGLLADADRMAGVLAQALERSRVAGGSCEAIYDGLRDKKAR